MRADGGAIRARLALRWLLVGEARAHPGRLFGTVIAIAVGVALGFAVHLVNGSAIAAFGEAVRGVNGAADLSVRAASPLGFDETLYPEVFAAEGIVDASPVVVLEATANGAAFTLLGTDIVRAANVTPSLIGARTSGVDTSSAGLFDEGALFLSQAALTAAGTAVGETIVVEANGERFEMRVAGTLAGAGDGQAIGTMDIAAAQWRFARLGRLDRIDLRLGDAALARPALEALLPADAVLSDGEDELAQGAQLSRAYRVNLQMLALVALVTGAFLVFSSQSLSVARRSRAFALLRTLGLPKGGVIAVVLLEGAAVGIVGGLLGLLGGYGLARLALGILGSDLGAGYFSGETVTLAFAPVAALVFFSLGIVAAGLGSLLPALAAARAAPAATLKAVGDVVDPRARVPVLPAIALFGAGVACALAPAIAGLPLLGFVGMALMLAGGVAGVPWLARRLLTPLARAGRGGTPALLAVRHIHGAPGEAAAALCGIVASTALVIAMATMVTSFRGAVDDWLGQVLSADLYVNASSGAGLDPATQESLRSLPGVGSIVFAREVPLTLASDRPPLTLIARDVAEARPAAMVFTQGGDADALAGRAAWVSEPAARLEGWGVGDAIALPIGAGATFTVAGIWRDYARQTGAIIVRAEDYTALTGDSGRGQAAVTVGPGEDVAAVRAAVLERLPDAVRETATTAEPSALRGFALELFDRSFAVTYVLQAVAILVGLAGVAATMASQTIARIREFGMLRHLGLTAGQIRAMLGIEGALLGVVGGVAGTLLGLALGQVLIHVINPQSFNWTMETRVPVGTIFLIVAALIASAALTATLAARRATTMNAVLAVREDW